MLLLNDTLSCSPSPSPCSSLFIIENSQSDTSVFHILSSPARLIKSTESQPTYTSIYIKLLLTHENTQYRVESNQSKRATAPCWKIFGFPAVVLSEDENKVEVIPGFASCKNCFETYRYIDSSTTNLNSHILSTNIAFKSADTHDNISSPQTSGCMQSTSAEEKRNNKHMCTMDCRFYENFFNS